ncbi:DEAD/DEAH box helicase [Alicyclobacillus pomorum]
MLPLDRRPARPGGTEEQMLTLHGLWFPEYFFLYGMEGTQVVYAHNFLFTLREPPIELPEHLLSFNNIHSEKLYIPQYTQVGTLKGNSTRRLPNTEVYGVRIPPAEAMRVLARIDLSGRSRFLRKPYVFGEDMLFWHKFARYVLRLLAMRRFLPTLKVSTDYHTYHSANSYFVADLSQAEDRQQLQTFADNMPPACWCFAPSSCQQWYRLPAFRLLEEIASQAVDCFVRESYAKRMPMPTQQRRHPNVVAEAWVQDLLQPKSLPIWGWRTTLDELRRDVESWLAEAKLRKANLRLQFRLVDPTPEVAAATDSQAQSGQDGVLCETAAPVSAPLTQHSAAADWHLMFVVQAVDIPSFSIPVQDIWRGTLSPETLEVLKISAQPLRDLVHAELSRACKIYSPLEQGLFPEPTEMDLTAKDAYHFLKDGAPALQKAGFSVVLPAWWTPAGRQRLRAKLRLRTPAHSSHQNLLGGRLGMSSLLEFEPQVSLGDESISMEELESLVRLNLPLVQIRGQWMEVNPQELQQTVQYIQRFSHSPLTLAELLKEHAALERSGKDELGGPLTFDLPDDFAAFLHGNWAPPKATVPSTLRGTLRPYQERGFSWLAAMTDMGFGVCLADDMGLGKTIQLIALLCLLKEGQDVNREPRTMQMGRSTTTHRASRSVGAPSLVICPTSVLGNWQRELEKFAPPLKVYVHHGPRRLHEEAFVAKCEDVDVVLTSYPLVPRDEADFTRIWWSLITLDEAQNIKNHESKQARSVCRLAADRKIAMTGTPVENRLAELWAIFRFLNPGFLGSAEEFRSQFAIPIERWQDEDRAQTLKRLVQPFLLRRVKTDKSIVADLPEKIEMKAYCTLSKEQVALYRASVEDFTQQIEQVEGIARRGLILAMLTKLKQICNHPALFLHDGSPFTPRRSGKLLRLAELLPEILDAGESVLVFTQYREMGELLCQFIEKATKHPPLFLHGGTPKRTRDEMVERFQQAGGPQVFVLSLRAGGVGLNLTRANHVIHYDRWWNPAVENQATDRAFRIGQQKNVQVHKLICRGTLEERIDELMELKQALSDQIMAEGESWITEMTTDELKQLFALRADVLEGRDDA